MINEDNYNTVFGVFDDTEQIGKMTSKAKDQLTLTYNATEKFINLLCEFFQDYPDLKDISAKLKDLNDYFANSLVIEKQISLKTGISNNRTVLKYKYTLAKNIIKDPTNFLDSIQYFVNSIESLKKPQAVQLKENVKLDAVDQQLLQTNSSAGSAFEKSNPLFRPAISLFANGDFKAQQAEKIEIKNLDQLEKISKQLQKFSDLSNINKDYRFGFKINKEDETTALTTGQRL